MHFAASTVVVCAGLHVCMLTSLKWEKVLDIVRGRTISYYDLKYDTVSKQ